MTVLSQALPLKADMNENESVYKCVWGLLNMNNPDIRSHAGTLLGKLLSLSHSDAQSI